MGPLKWENGESQVGPKSTWLVVSGWCGGNTGCNVWGWDKRLDFFAEACLVADDSSLTRDIGSP